jgi:hypothetical protein
MLFDTTINKRGKKNITRTGGNQNQICTVILCSGGQKKTAGIYCSEKEVEI